MASPPPPLYPRLRVQLDLDEAKDEADTLERGARTGGDVGAEGILGVGDGADREAMVGGKAPHGKAAVKKECREAVVVAVRVGAATPTWEMKATNALPHRRTQF
jgi:hypothetical protein